MTKTIVIKWEKQVFNVELDESKPASVFKESVYAATGVPPERQKIMVKGGKLKDDHDWKKLKLKNKSKLMMMGRSDKDEAPKFEAPKEKTVFLEDLSAAEREQAVEATPPGLKNLGNTCYMNSTVQCLRAAAEVREALDGFQVEGTSVNGSGDGDGANASGADPATLALIQQMLAQDKQADGALSGMLQTGASSSSLVVPASADQETRLALHFRALLEDLQSSRTSFAPFQFWQLLRRVFPQFDERGDGGGFAQQDADECWGQLMACLSRKVKALPDLFEGKMGVERVDVGAKLEESANKDKKAEDDDKNKDKDEGEKEVSDKFDATESFTKLSCHIDTNTNYLVDGLRDGMVEQLEVRGEGGLPKLVEKRRSIVKLPHLLTVQFVRFFWRAALGRKTKITKPVKYPFVFDAIEFCSKGTKATLMANRRLLQEYEDAITGLSSARSSKIDHAPKKKKKANSESKKTDEEIAQAKADRLAELATLRAEAKAKCKAVVESASRLGNDTGYYELLSVLTHQGRTADGGHYIGWVRESTLGSADDKNAGSNSSSSSSASGTGAATSTTGSSSSSSKKGKAADEEKWLKFDDDKVSRVPRADIEKLSGQGGSDWHIAYLCLYRSVSMTDKVAALDVMLARREKEEEEEQAAAKRAAEDEGNKGN